MSAARHGQAMRDTDGSKWPNFWTDLGQSSWRNMTADFLRVRLTNSSHGTPAILAAAPAARAEAEANITAATA